MASIKVSQLFIYPIKSCGGFLVSSSYVQRRGLEYDRRWMLVDENNRFISQRENALLALLRIRISSGVILVHVWDKPHFVLKIPMDTSEFQKINVSIWNDSCQALVYPSSINEELSTYIQQPCKLVYMPDDTHRQVDQRYADPGAITSFSDGYPILLLSEASLDVLNNKLEQHVPMHQFRPNIVISGATPHQEDDIHFFKIQQVLLQGVKRCARCNIPSIHQDTLEINNKLIPVMTTYRMIDHKLLFGQNVLVHHEGEIRVGDELIIQRDEL